MNSSHVASRLPSHFGNVKLGSATGVDLTNAGNAVAQITIVNGTEYIIRRITVSQPSATVATGNVAIITSNDGNTSNAVSNNVVLTNANAAHTYVDLGLATAALATSYTAGALYVLVNTGVAGTVTVNVYGDIIAS